MTGYDRELMIGMEASTLMILAASSEWGDMMYPCAGWDYNDNNGVVAGTTWMLMSMAE